MKHVKELILPIGIIAAVLVILVPLPGSVVDFLLAANIAAAALMLLTALTVRAPLEFSVFPTLLLATTLGRLVLNVATTRLILTRADQDGMAAAGRVVESFSQFVAGDRVVVGLVIFAIILLIQFVVVTKGTARVSEVAARFALDGLPGKQMAIDGDLSAGVIDEHEARRRREELLREADFHGAMDGAGKFVRGDAVAGLAITCINFVGGLAIGMTEGGLGPMEAGGLYARLTIGDGLVSQVPDFLIALSEGILITRGGDRGILSSRLWDQLFTRPETLGAAAALLVLLGLTGLP
ncbi:MAG: flagellar biosynthesis protein FlhA, partial [Planctomycetales bacterium]